MKTIKPMGEYVLVEAVLEDNLTASGIVLPDTGKEKPGSGKVLDIGPGKTLENGSVQSITDLSVGDLIFFAKYSPEELELDGKKYFLVKYSSIFAKGI
ncbi:MAG TPA: co-chaperone GroES [Candidatus Absconditabacterales bacterium]|nr:co-chaperone GroES [Candidatus Absconditabacterales bacterium]